MGRKPTPQPLAIPPPSALDDDDDTTNIDVGPKSAPSLRSPKSPRSPFRFSTKLGGQGFGDHPSMQPAEQQERRRNFSSSPSTPSQSSFSQHLSTDKREERDRAQGRDRPSTSPAKGGFFANYKASKSSSRLQTTDTVRQITEETMSIDTERPVVSGKVLATDVKRRDRSTDKSIARRPVASNSRSDLSLAASNESTTTASNSSNTALMQTPASKRGGKPKPFSLLNRTKSIRADDQIPGETTPIIITEPERTERLERPQVYGAMKTAPIRPEHDKTFRDIMSSSARNRSADRQPQTAREPPMNREHKEHIRMTSTFRENGGQGFLNNLKSSSSKAVNISHRFLNKVGRSGSTTEKEVPVDDEHYLLKVINLPLIEQTRLTRISKKLEDSRDKTEFWMPAFPWRAIDYLNYRGTETEGLYRVPGSGPQIKKWQRRFDEELDIDLFEQEDLYDINIIGSMLKAWLRELPDELLPKAAQDRVARECVGSETVPQVLIDELSNLRPFNYYLLFAITCHLSLLLAHSGKNKMDFRNLCICFQPCMKIDAFCFKFLVVDWRDCWKGCKTEDEWIAKEYAVFDMLPPSSAGGQSSTAVESHDERNVSSSDSSKPSSVSLENAPPPKLKSKPPNLPLSPSTNSLISNETSSTTTTLTVKDNRLARNNGDLTLSPITPLSPMILYDQKS